MLAQEQDATPLCHFMSSLPDLNSLILAALFGDPGSVAVSEGSPPSFPPQDTPPADPLVTVCFLSFLCPRASQYFGELLSLSFRPFFLTRVSSSSHRPAHSSDELRRVSFFCPASPSHLSYSPPNLRLVVFPTFGLASLRCIFRDPLPWLIIHVDFGHLAPFSF